MPIIQEPELREHLHSLGWENQPEGLIMIGGKD